MKPDITKAKVMAINTDSISLLTLTGPYKDRLYGIEPRAGLKVDQFVDVIVSPSGQSVQWPETD